MKEAKSIKPIGALLPIIGLAILLLLSPCKVRNFIQTELGIPQTEVTNKSQTTLKTSTCNDYQIGTLTVVKAKSSTQFLPSFPEANVEYRSDGVVNKCIHYSKERSLSVSPIPFYILYQNLKVYL